MVIVHCQRLDCGCGLKVSGKPKTNNLLFTSWFLALHKYVARCIRSCGSKDMNLLSRRSIVEAKTAGALLSERGNAGTLV